MKLHAFIIACLVLGARAASINPPVDEKLDALDNVSLDEVVNEPEQIDQIAVNEVVPIAEIPVPVVEEQQLKKIDENSNDYVPDIDDVLVIKRAELDLKNPGPPQRQEHETQNPGHYSDMEKSLFSVREKLEQTRQVFDEQIRSVATNFETLIERSETVPVIQEKIQNLNYSVSEQIAGLTNILKSYVNPEGNKLKSDLKPEIIPNVDVIQSDLKKVQDHFDHGISAMTEGIELLAIIKEEDEAIKGKDDAATTVATTVPPQQPANFFQNVGNVFQSLVTSFSTGINNRLTNLQNLLNPNQAQPAATPVQTTSSQTAQTNSTPQGTLIQALQNAWQNVPFFQRPQNAQVSQQAIASNAVPAQASNSVPVASQISTQSAAQQPQVSSPQTQTLASPQSAQPAEAQPAQQAQAQPGPIQNFIQNNPIIKRIQSAVQTGQTTPNPNKPRETEPTKDDPKGHGGNNNNQGYNISDNGIKCEPPRMESLGNTVGHDEVKGPIEEKPSSVPEKTE